VKTKQHAVAHAVAHDVHVHGVGVQVRAWAVRARGDGPRARVCGTKKERQAGAHLVVYKVNARRVVNHVQEFVDDVHDGKRVAARGFRVSIGRADGPRGGLLYRRRRRR
jgi:hypothetical protein